MNNTICIPKDYFFILIIIFIIFVYMYDKIKSTSMLEIKNTKNIAELQPLKQLLENGNRFSQNNVDNIFLRKTLENRDRSIILDPLIAPERRVDLIQYPMTIKNQLNIPTRGYPDNYQMMGIVTREADEKILQLFGRATFPGSNQYEYYVTTSEFGFQNKIPVNTRGGKEILDNDIIHIPEFNKNKGEFKVKLYNYNTPRYNPYII
jgi:hypothetical protein